MSEFLLVFRRDYQTPELQPSPHALQNHLQHWANWFRSLAAQDKIAHPVIHFDGEGKVITGKKINPGPYRGVGGSIGGVLLLNAANYEEAIVIAGGSPILEYGGSIEIRLVLQ
ncbi:hypothetical protein GCM10023149_24480 [Mucilaginibacter gynuensis]|uniref:YCII-related domain-containing protein n=1 Tax=Mucilaginibacter gynuensis TaxID=1302236 RepID=A0ABP8GFL7_9SPHI